MISSLYSTQVPRLHKPPLRAGNLHGARHPGVAGEYRANSGLRLSRLDGGFHNHEPLRRGSPDSNLQVGEEGETLFCTSRTLTGLFCSRLYYLFQGHKTINFIEEENLLHFLGYYSPVLSAMLITLHMAENFVFYADHPFLFHYR